MGTWDARSEAAWAAGEQPEQLGASIPSDPKSIIVKTCMFSNEFHKTNEPNAKTFKKI